MSENRQPGDLIALLQITGLQTQISTRLIYNSSDVRTNGTNYFSLNFTNLYLRHRKFIILLINLFNLLFDLALDYEWWTLNNYSNPFRFIVACTILSTQMTQNIDFQLDLIDANDNPPRFNQSFYEISVNETIPINTIISAGIFAIDYDSGSNSLFSYYLLNDTSQNTVKFSFVRMNQ